MTFVALNLKKWTRKITITLRVYALFFFNRYVDGFILMFDRYYLQKTKQKQLLFCFFKSKRAKTWTWKVTHWSFAEKTSFLTAWCMIILFFLECRGQSKTITGGFKMCLERSVPLILSLDWYMWRTNVTAHFPLFSFSQGKI